MKFDNHIINRFLNDEKLLIEMAETQASKYGALNTELFVKALDPFFNKNYFITRPVLDALDLFDVKKAMTAEGWKVFEHLPEGYKKTFILPDNIVVRAYKENGVLSITHLAFEFKKGDKLNGMLYWTIFWVDTVKNIISTNITDEQAKDIVPFTYALLCFMDLTQNDEVVLKPNGRYGTQKSGKIINTLNQNIIVVNSRWNTDVRIDGLISVRGHIALRWSGEGRTIPKLVFIEPYSKAGYLRRSGKHLHNN